MTFDVFYISHVLSSAAGFICISLTKFFGTVLTCLLKFVGPNVVLIINSPFHFLVFFLSMLLANIIFSEVPSDSFISPTAQSTRFNGLSYA